MGADGHVLFLPSGDVLGQFIDLDPSRIGWYKRSVLGTEVLWCYWDTERDNDAWGSPAQYVRDFDSAVHRSRPDRPTPPERMRNLFPYNPRYDIEFIEKCKADPDHEKKMAEGKRYSEFEAWLSAHAEDWEVWT